MPSGDEQPSAPAGAPAHDENPLSNPASPTDTRYPLRYEPVTHEPDEGLSSSFQSTDTVRRRPDTQVAGHGTWELDFILY